MSINSIKERIVGFIFFRDHYCSWPGRHSKNLCGQPIYYWKFKAALESAYFEKIVVWTEVKAALQMAREMSPRFVTVERPLSECREPEWINGKSIYSNIHRRQWSMGQGEIEAEKLLSFKPTIMIYLEPTCPLERGQDIDRLIEFSLKKNASLVYLAVRISHFVFFQNAHFVYPGLSLWGIRRQDVTLKPYVAGGTKLFKVPRDFSVQKIWLIDIPFKNSICIHNKEDLELAEFYMRKRLTSINKPV